MQIEISQLNDLTPKQIFEMFKLRVSVFVVEQDCPYQEVDDDDLTAFHVLMTNNEHELIAYARIMHPSETTARFGRVIVAPMARKTGLGKKLINSVLAYINEELPQVTTIEIQAQHYLHDFYASFGFQSVSDVYLEDEIPHEDMEKTV